MKNNEVRSVFEIKNEIDELENKIKALRDEYKDAEQREYEDSLRAFTEKYLSTKEDIDRITSLIESAAGLVSKTSSVSRNPLPKTDVENRETKQKKESEKTITQEKTKKPVREKKVQSEEEDIPVKSNVKSKPEKAVNASDVVEEEPKVEEINWSGVFGDIEDADDDQVQLPVKNPELKKFTKATASEPVKAVPKEEKESKPQVNENTEPDDDFNFASIFGDSLFDDEPEENSEPEDSPSFDTVFKKDESAGINVSDVIMIEETDNSLIQFKKKNTVVQAENKLLSAISSAVDEGWVKKRDIQEYFFDNAELEYQKSSFYADAAKVVDGMKGIFSQHAGNESSDLFNAYYLYPYQVRGKAVALAMNDLKKYLET